MRYKRRRTKKLFSPRKRAFLSYMDIQTIESYKCLGKGTNGHAYRVPVPGKDDMHVVAKVSPVRSDMLGDSSNAFRSEHAEPRILRVLYKHIVEPNVSPHIIAPIGLPKVHNDKAVYFMEYANGKTLFNFLDTFPRSTIARCAPEILFQVCFTLHAIHSFFPTFRHNDLIASNIFLQKNKPGESKIYRLADGRSFCLSGCGYVSLLADMDFACIPGLVDNYKPIEQYFSYPTQNINAHKDGLAVDLYLTAKCLIESRALSPEFRKGLFNLYASDDPRWPEHPLRSFQDKANFWRPPICLTPLLPTPMDMLSSPLFSLFATSASCNADYVIPSQPSIQDCFLPNQKRHCIAFVHLPRVSWYAKLEPINPDIDAAAYAPSRIHHSYEEHMRTLFFAIYCAQELNKKAWSKVWQRVLFLARSATSHWSLPFLWWPPAFACAFVEATSSFVDVIPLGHVCWTFEEWAAFLCKHVQCARALSNPIAWVEFSMQWGW